ncbi:MAG TPA: STAS domain-containing protein [Ignavibacteriales bacterium]|jgi:anti-sigma B factor antagonist|nr:STAS domain-containing protein [Ignavibacteriales bacterium]
MTEFNISKEFVDNDIVIIKVSGFLDAHTAPKLEDEISQLLDDKKYKIIIDFSSLNYISSAGLGVFMANIEIIRSNGGDIKFYNLPDKVFEVFDMLGFPMLYEFYKDLNLAIEKFKEQSNAE